VLSLRRPFSVPSARAWARQRREENEASVSTAPLFPTPPLPKQVLASPVGASKEKARG
jgi:NADH-quinone oxidoreductase subunit H